MDQRSTAAHSSSPSAVSSGLAGSNPNRASTASVSAAIAQANAQLAPLTEPDLQSDHGGDSLAEMAARDLDATLQLLAERAQYITEATGAAIALRRGEHSDMLCRASAGSNAPELGALLSMEYGLSGESVRTGQTMHCQDAETDPRVNREGCRQLGIASVVVMPIVTEQQVLGVFELFSGRAHAFEQRDISALQRLGGLVETAVKHAVAAQAVHAVEKIPQGEQNLSSADTTENDPAKSESTPSKGNEKIPQSQDVSVASDRQAKLLVEEDQPAPANEIKVQTALPEALQPTESEETKPEPEPQPEPVKKSFFWSAATQSQPSATALENARADAIPPVLRSLQKCQACGFPVSQGRTLCVECEEKQWRGEAVVAPGKKPETAVIPMVEPDAAIAPKRDSPASVEAQVVAVPLSTEPSAILAKPADWTAAESSTLFASSAAPTESWFAANKYIIAALLLVSLIIAAIVWMR